MEIRFSLVVNMYWHLRQLNKGIKASIIVAAFVIVFITAPASATELGIVLDKLSPAC